jgi:hypothetical protein
MGPGTQEKPPAKAFRRSLRVRVVAACTEEETSPTEFAEREQIEPANASYYFQKLAKEGYLRVARKKRIRGLTRYYYVAIRQAVIVDAEFAELTGQQHGVTEATLRDLLQRHGGAWRAKTLRKRAVDFEVKRLRPSQARAAGLPNNFGFSSTTFRGSIGCARSIEFVYRSGRTEHDKNGNC